jgi:hypothetical protein
METAVAGLEPRPEGRLARARRAAWPTQETPVLIEPLGMNLVPRYIPPLNMKTSACLVPNDFPCIGKYAVFSGTPEEIRTDPFARHQNTEQRQSPCGCKLVERGIAGRRRQAQKYLSAAECLSFANSTRMSAFRCSQPHLPEIRL